MNSPQQWHLAGCVDLRIAPSFPWTNAWIEALGDVPSLASSAAAGRSAVLNVAHASELPLATAREVQEGIYRSPGGIIDRQHGVMLSWPEGGDVLVRSAHPALEWVMVGLQLALLPTGRTFVHAAGVARDNVAIVFPSWGGIGKTGLVARLVREHGWKLLGDDLVIVDAAGQCFGFQKPMVLYPYHRALFPELFAAGRGPMAPVSATRALSQAAILLKPLLRSSPRLLQLARRHNPQSVRVNPSDVFGRGQLQAEAKLNAVLFLEREAGVSGISVVPAEGGLASRLMGTTLNEFHPRCVQVCHAAMGAGFLPVQRYFGAWLDVLERGLSRVQQSVVRIPDDMTVEEMSGEVAALLDDRLQSGGVRTV